MSYDRYAYVKSNPITYIDPSGHSFIEHDDPNTGIPIVDIKNTPKFKYRYRPSYVDIWDAEGLGATDRIVAFIKSEEGYKHSPYIDTTGNCTVGIGHKLHSDVCTPDELNAYYSDEEILEFFQNDLKLAEKYVRAMFQTLDDEYPGEGNPFPITQAQYDALVSFTFNTGAGRLINLVRGTIQPDTGTFNYDEFAHKMSTVYAQGGEGVPARREYEINLFVNGVYPDKSKRSGDNE